MTDIDEALHFARNRYSILFCGAGFSAECINEKDEYLPNSEKLLEILNDELNFKDNEHTELSMAATDYMGKVKSKYHFLKLLKEHYTIKNVSQNIIDILKFKWDVIYTTNYDNAIGYALNKNGIQYQSINNTQSLKEIEENKGVKVIHLHGFVERWEQDNFDNSRVLDSQSYLDVADKNIWASILREDYAKANYIFFAGFSNNDFYLRKSLYEITINKNNVFFINSKKDRNDRGLQIRQKELGTPYAIGLDSFAEKIIETIKKDPPDQNLEDLNCFEKFKLKEIETHKASIKDQEKFLKMGVENISLHQKDIFENGMSYRIERSITESCLQHLKKSNSVCFIDGGISSGKSILLKELMIRLAVSDYDVFYIKKKLDNAAEEVDKILKLSQNPIIFIDDCFALYGSLESIVEKVNNANNLRLVLASRSLARDNEKNIESLIVNKESYFEAKIYKLNDEETKDLIHVLYRIGAWVGADKVSSKKVQINYNYNNRLSNILISVLKSEHIIDKFEESLENIRKNKSIRESLILALYLRGCGINLSSERLLSESLGRSTGIPRQNSNTEISEWISISEETGEIHTIASINARDVLKIMFDDEEITSIVISAVSNVAKLRKQFYEFRNIYRGLIRYTNLKQVVENADVREHFFNRLSEFPFCNRDTLFWLQYSIAMRDSGILHYAEKYLDVAYSLAGSYGMDNENDSTFRQIEDQKAALLLEKGIQLDSSDKKNSGAKMQYFKDASEILIRLIINHKQISSHPYNKINDLFPLYFQDYYNLSNEYLNIYTSILGNCKKVAEESHITVRTSNLFLYNLIGKSIFELERIIEKINIKKEDKINNTKG